MLPELLTKPETELLFFADPSASLPFVALRKSEREEKSRLINRGLAKGRNLTAWAEEERELVRSLDNILRKQRTIYEKKVKSIP